MIVAILTGLSMVVAMRVVIAVIRVVVVDVSRLLSWPFMSSSRSCDY
jgi:hypothetical protein